MSQLTVATFNVRYGTAADDDRHKWENRWSVFGDTVGGLGADVLGLQEVLSFQLVHVRHVLAGFETVGVGRTNGLPDGGEMVPIVWNPNRLDRIDAGHFWLCPEPHLVGVRGWDAKYVRMATWVALRFRDPPQPVFTHFNTHLDNRGETARVEAAKLITRRIAALGPHMPVILTGDFNATEADPAYAVFRDAGLADAYRLAHPTPNPAEDGTYHQFSGSHAVRRIDWILVSPHWRVLRCRIDHTSHGNMFPSDHFPVVAELELADA